MLENNLIQIDGTVTKWFPKRVLGIALDNGHSVLASYPQRANLIIIPGDRVRVELKYEDAPTGRVTSCYARKKIDNV